MLPHFSQQLFSTIVATSKFHSCYSVSRAFEFILEEDTVLINPWINAELYALVRGNTGKRHNIPNVRHCSILWEYPIISVPYI